MPELGKATYLVELNTAQFTGALDDAEANANAATAKIGESLGMVEENFASVGEAAQASATEVADANARAVASTEESATKQAAAMGTLKKKFIGMGKIGHGGLGLAAAAAGYFFVKGGIDYIKNVQAANLLVANAVKNTGKVTGVTAEQINKLSEAFIGVKGQTYATNLVTGQLLARFTNIRNLGPGLGMVYNRAFTAVQNIVAGSNMRNARMAAIALGKALQDPVKNYNVLSRAGLQFNKDLIKQIYDTKGPLAAQNYLLDQIQQKYGGAAQASLHSFSGQWTRLKDSLDKISASILLKLIPAFTKVAGFLNKHTTLVRDLILALIGLAAAWLAVKVTAIAFNTVMALYNFGAWIAGFVGLAGAEEGATGAAVAGRTAMLAFGESFLWALGPIGLLVAGLLVLEYTIHKVAAAQAQANAAVLRAGMGSEKRSSEALFFGARERSYMSGGQPGGRLSQVEAAKRAAADTRKQFNDPTFGTSGDKSYGSMAAAKKAADAFGASLKKSDFNTSDAAKPGTLPNNLEMATLKAEASGNKAAELAAYRANAAWLTSQLHSGKLSPVDMIKVQKALTATDKKIATLTKQSATGAGGILGKIPGYSKLAFNAAKAATTKGLKDDRAALKAEEEFLQGIVNNRKYSLAVRTKAANELKMVMDKLKTVNKGIIDSTHATAQELQAALDLRGTFFGQFASNVFGQTANGLTMGAQAEGGDFHYHQSNTFHEIPKDRHKLARQLRLASQHGMMTS